MRGAEAGSALGDPVPRLPHRPLLRAVHRRDLEGGLRVRDRRRRGLSLRRYADDPGRALGAHARGRGRRALRGGRAVPEPSLLHPSPRGPPGGGPARRRVGRRHRPRDRRRPGRRAGLSAPRREDDRPLRVPPRECRRRGRAVDPRGVRARVLRRRAERSAGGADPSGSGRPCAACRVPELSAGLARGRAHAASRREATSRRARGRERAACTGVRFGDPRGSAVEADRCARGAPRGAQPREPSGSDRVLRRLEHPGRVDRRVDDGLRGRALEERALPHVRDPRARRPGRRRRDARGRLTTLRAPPRRRAR